jgi:hypothetical protein
LEQFEQSKLRKIEPLISHNRSFYGAIHTLISPFGKKHNPSDSIDAVTKLTVINSPQWSEKTVIGKISVT